MCVGVCLCVCMPACMCVCVCVSVCKCVCVCVCEIHVPKSTSFSLSMIISRLLTTKKISQFIQLCGRISCFSPLYFFQPPPSFMLKTSHTLKIYSYATRKWTQWSRVHVSCTTEFSATEPWGLHDSYINGHLIMWACRVTCAHINTNTHKVMILYAGRADA